MTLAPETTALLRDLAKRPANHDKVKASFFELLVREFGLERSALDFEVRAPVIAGRLDALVGRTVFEAKRDSVASAVRAAKRAITIGRSGSSSPLGSPTDMK